MLPLASILATKLYSPPLRLHSVSRPRLTQRINEGFVSGRRLTLISAPAGYGKTTLAAEWLKENSHPYTWLSIDENDNDPVRLFSHFIAALQKIDSNIGKDIKDLFSSPQLPAPETLVTILVNDLFNVAVPFIMVLDDFHMIRNQYIHAALQFLLDHQPPFFHLVLITREDPPLALPRLRVRGQITEARVDDLRFTPEESKGFFKDTMALALEEQAVASLGSRTEGWVAGLQLAAISLQGKDTGRISEFIEAFSGSHRYVIDYLVEEVLNQLDESIRTFLCRTSILDRFCASLCDAVTGRDDSKIILNDLEQGNLFLVPLDEERQWYRYHHLFADFLRIELEEREKAALNSRAAEWFNAKGFTSEAIKHALSSADLQKAGELIKKESTATLARAQIQTLRAWLDAFPDEYILQDSELCSFKAVTLFLSGEVPKAISFIQAFNGFQPDQVKDTARGRILCILAHLKSLQEDPQSISLAHEALQLIGDKDLVFRIFTLISLGQAQRGTGDAKASSKTLLEAFETGRKLGFGLPAVSALMDLAFNLYIQGQQQRALELCRGYLKEYSDSKGKPRFLSRILYIPMGAILYERNQLDQALELLLEGREVSAKTIGKVLRGDCEVTIARLFYAQGETEKAFEFLDQCRKSVDAVNYPSISLRYDALNAELCLKSGRIDEAVLWAESCGLSPEDKPTSLKETAYYTLVRVFLAQGKAAKINCLLKSLEEFARNGERLGRLITLLILRAQALASTGEIEKSRASMSEAITLASSQGYYRSFLDAGREVIKLLREVRAVDPIFVDTIISIAEGQDKEESQSSLKQKPSGVLIEPLSEREIEILKLISEGLSNAEISRKLFITLGTTKWHANNIYSKLGVNSRTQAISRARELKLI